MDTSLDVGFFFFDFVGVILVGDLSWFVFLAFLVPYGFFMRGPVDLDGLLVGLPLLTAVLVGAMLGVRICPP